MACRTLVGFVLLVLLASRAGFQAQGSPAQDQPPSPVYTPGPDIVDSKLLKEEPRYTSEVMRARIQGQVQLELDEFERAIKEGTPGLIAPRKLTSVRPAYPSQVRAAGLQGRVFVEVVIAPDGRVTAARVKPSLDSTGTQGGRAAEALEAEAMRAARQWTFEPARLDGKAVRAIATLEFSFSLK